MYRWSLALMAEAGDLAPNKRWVFFFYLCPKRHVCC